MNKQFFMITLLVSSVAFGNVAASIFGTSPKGIADAHVDDFACMVDEKGNEDCVEPFIAALRAGKARLTVCKEVPFNTGAYLTAEEKRIRDAAAQREKELQWELDELKAVTTERERILRTAAVKSAGGSADAIAKLEREAREEEALAAKMRKEGQNLVSTADQTEVHAQQTKEEAAKLRAAEKNTATTTKTTLQNTTTTSVKK